MYRKPHDRDFADLRDRQEARDAAFVQAHQTLYYEAVNAFAHGGGHQIADTTVRYAFVSDWLAGPDARSDDLIAALQAAADGKPEAREMAQALIQRFALDYADFYAEAM